VVVVVMVVVVVNHRQSSPILCESRSKAKSKDVESSYWCPTLRISIAM
jgi:hypothetical protein